VYNQEKIVLATVLDEFADFDCRKYFKMCGYSANGQFDPNTNFEFVLKEAGMVNERQSTSKKPKKNKH
jgi:hypothetical protein